MDFGRYLFHTGRLTSDELHKLHQRQLTESLSTNTKDGARLLDLNQIRDVEPLRECPFGEVLSRSTSTLPNVLRRAGGQSLDDLVDEWHDWHRMNLEPICIYSLASRLGRCLYRQQIEKKLVAQFLVDAEVDHEHTIIRDNDVVVIMDGTSGLYVGLAIAAARHDVTIHTSNSALIREYRDNPAVARHLATLFVLGGQADFDVQTRRSEYCGVYGEKSEDQYRKAISERPSATVVVVPVSYINPQEGPVVAGRTAQVRAAALNECFAKKDHSVRQVVFITDYTKHDGAHSQGNGLPIFPPDVWRTFVEQHKESIRIVTAPPPHVRLALRLGEGREVLHRDLSTIQGQQPFASTGQQFDERDRRYDSAAKLLDKMVNYVINNKAHPRFHEAYFSLLNDVQCVFELKGPRRNCGRGQFVAALETLLHDDVSQLEVIIADKGDHTLAFVYGRTDPLAGIKPLVEFQSNGLDDFTAATGLANVVFKSADGTTRFPMPRPQRIGA